MMLNKNPKLATKTLTAPHKIGAVSGAIDRDAFWQFCLRVGMRKSTLTPHEVDKLFVDQRWRCAVSGIPFDAPRGRRKPFGPSVDRIRPGGRYVVGNVRLVCNIVNFAMNEWGAGALYKLVNHMMEFEP